MDRDRTDSLAIASIGYDLCGRILEVEFTSGAVYRYRNVPVEVYMRFRDADSKGHFFQANIRDRYEYDRMPAG